MADMKAKRQHKRGAALEIQLIEDAISVLGRCESSQQRLRILGAAFAYISSAAYARVSVDLVHTNRAMQVSL